MSDKMKTEAREKSPPEIWINAHAGSESEETFIAHSDKVGAEREIRGARRPVKYVREDLLKADTTYIPALKL